MRADINLNKFLSPSFSFHLHQVNGYSPSHPNTVRWAKIFTWRANGDGINPFGNVLVEDSFIRTQDDSIYVNGLGIRRVVFWNDANGSAFVLSPLGSTSLEEHGILVEDCTVGLSSLGFRRRQLEVR